MPQPIDSFAEIRRFYTQALGCRVIDSQEGRLALLLHGQPLTLQRNRPASAVRCDSREDAGDTHAAEPSAADPGMALTLREPDEGIVLDIDAWCDVEQRLREHGVPVSISVPRPMGLGPGQQCLMRISDPLGTVVTLRGFAVSEVMLAA